MAMQSGAMVVPEKIPVQWYNHHQQQPYHQVDEREGFLVWMRSEFAASNAIIDALCHHLRAVGEPGEYDGVLGAVQQRRFNWNPILHMQQYFSVADVVYALQQVGWKRQQKGVGFEGGARMGGGPGKEFRRGGSRHRGGLEVQSFGGDINGKDLNNGYTKSNLKIIEHPGGGEKVEKEEEKEEVTEFNEKSEENGSAMRERSTQGAVAPADVEGEDSGSCSVDGSGLLAEKSKHEVSPKYFIATEICDGKPVNIAEGLKLYKDLFDDSETFNLNNLVSDLRTAGKKGQLEGQTFVVLKRPMKGRGREMIQFGVPIADAPPEDEVGAEGTSRDPKIEPIPELLQDAIQQLLTKNVVSIKPDSAIIDIFNEGDHSQPHIWPQWFGRPICVIFLTECEMSFGKVIPADSPGNYRGALNLSLSPGSLIAMQGRCANFARHAIPSLQKQRILITLVKSQSKKLIAGEGQRFLSPSATWAPPHSRSPSQVLRPGAPKHFVPVSSAGVLAASSARSPLPPPNGIQPMFVTTPIAYPAPVAIPPTSVAWPATPPRHPQPRLPVPGTGVFLPSQGPANSSHQPIASTENSTIETSEEDSSVGKSNGPRSPPKADDEATEQECSGSSDKSNGGGTVGLEEEEGEHENSDVGNSGGTA